MKRINFFFPSVFLGFVLFFFILLQGIAFFQNRLVSKQFEKDCFDMLERKKELFIKDLNSSISSLFYISDSFKFLNIGSVDEEFLTSHWVSFVDKLHLYDQIRFIDNKGDELIRVNYLDSGSYAISPEELQNKLGRYYFDQTINTEEDTVFISHLDLNVEQGKVEIPITPTIRLGLAYPNPGSKYDGMIMLNCFAQPHLDNISSLHSMHNTKIMMVNEKGDWLINQAEPQTEWSFMYADKNDISFKNQFPEEWSKIQEFTTGRELSKNGLFFYTEVDLHKELHELGNTAFSNINETEKYYLISYVQPSQVEYKKFPSDLFTNIVHIFELDKGKFIFVFFLSIMLTVIFFKYTEYKRQIRYFSDFDGLTKVFNRRAGLLQANQKLQHLPKDYTMTACFVDINGLKQVNDTLGHKAGDELIVTISESIKAALRSCDIVMRMGGDEFLLMLIHRKGNSPETVWERIVAHYDIINKEGNRDYEISASHGMSFPYADGTTLDDMIQDADTKMYQEKKVIKQDLQVLRKKKL